MVVEIKQPKKSIKYPTKEVSRNLRTSVHLCSAHARPPVGGQTAFGGFRLPEKQDVSGNGAKTRGRPIRGRDWLRLGLYIYTQ